jgi:hypothetical protein
MTIEIKASSTPAGQITDWLAATTAHCATRDLQRPAVRRLKVSAVAGATTRLRLLTSVLVAPYYPALVLANQAAPWTSCPAAA